MSTEIYTARWKCKNRTTFQAMGLPKNLALCCGCPSLRRLTIDQAELHLVCLQPVRR
ncbi:hypothetical protein Desti_3617 [Desulfomonile tiedjei DSM 6799]|uniref:Uncharacterized protein n=1 Tax=Desulfomonile tiedjei (strain ATCC 49306 / DSM 6799 / DCB-1) TaxID=706587 RepID=I4C9M4_DESTA|nr:hypothetical protein Desti_3617 [Desulfomonile tiedjei DSM 6799]